jgi:hypothetical protein
MASISSIILYDELTERLMDCICLKNDPFSFSSDLDNSAVTRIINLCQTIWFCYLEGLQEEIKTETKKKCASLSFHGKARKVFQNFLKKTNNQDFLKHLQTKNSLLHGYFIERKAALKDSPVRQLGELLVPPSRKFSF